jgi:SET and MYND domain-containing protein
VHKAECKVFERVKSGGPDYLPTPVRTLLHVLLRADMKAAVTELEGHVDAYRRDRGEWSNIELQAMAALHYLERRATPKRLNEAMEFGCKVLHTHFCPFTKVYKPED